MTTATDRWRVVIPADKAKALLHDERFHALLAFARGMNVVRLVMEDFTRNLDVSRPAERRRYVGNIFQAGAMLNDLRVAGDRLGQWWRDLPEYASWRAVWAGDPLGHPPLNVLIELRNTAVAHFDSEPYRLLLLREKDCDKLIWADGEGPSMGNLYFELADRLAIHSLLGDVPDETTFWTRYAELVDGISLTLRQLHGAGARLISAITRQLGATSEAAT